MVEPLEVPYIAGIVSVSLAPCISRKHLAIRENKPGHEGIGL
ncbi:hypothetical protein GA0115253_1027920 [Streptomyces sp. Termitarium-T10T-6]|nr:hypothetical protein GA0115253_1027920 [Streptomyces sp. Termitarium-T10T-6]